MTRTSRPIPRVDPSARDPIGSWLDVFIALLALPRAQRQTIRDELEDHLRSRVDDLLITGMTEPEAVRAAVGELGETADLARAFRTAARPPHTRRLLMTAAACTTIGAALAIGIATLTGAPSAPAQHAADTSPALAAASAAPRIALRGATFGQLFDTLAQHTPKPVLIHWDRLEQNGITPDTEVGLDVDPLPPQLVHTLLRERAESLAGEPIAVHETDELVEVSTQSHFDRRNVTLMTYDVRDLIELRSGIDAGKLVSSGETTAWRTAAHDVLEAIVTLAEPEAWSTRGGDVASGQISGASLLIDAPNRLHERVKHVLRVMREDAQRTVENAMDIEQRELESRNRTIQQAHDQLFQAVSDRARYSNLYEELIVQRQKAYESDDQSEVKRISLILPDIVSRRELAAVLVARFTELVADLEVEQARGGGR